MQNNELQHVGVKGMRWGHRQASSDVTTRVVRGHGGTGKYATKDRQLAGDKRDLNNLNNGKHLSVGLTKSRQEAYDKRDRANLEKRIAKNENKSIKKEAGAPAKYDSPKVKHKALKVGAGIVAGLTASNLGGAVVYNLTGSTTAATVAGSVLGIMGGTKVYEWTKSM